MGTDDGGPGGGTRGPPDQRLPTPRPRARSPRRKQKLRDDDGDGAAAPADDAGPVRMRAWVRHLVSIALTRCQNFPNFPKSEVYNVVQMITLIVHSLLLYRFI